MFNSDDDSTSNPRTPLAYRRMASREENVDVFARLGAGTQDPTPGGRIRSCTDKVRACERKNQQFCNLKYP